MTTKNVKVTVDLQKLREEMREVLARSEQTREKIRKAMAGQAVHEERKNPSK